VQDIAPTAEQEKMIHATIAAVTRDVEQLSFNTAIARMMEFVNFFTKEEVRPRQAMETLTLLLAPFAPHLCEELWAVLGHSNTLTYEPWPVFDPQKLKAAAVEIPLQINGKLRAKMTVPADCSPEELEQAARSHDRLAELLEGKQIVKAVVVPGRMVNFVVK
jgi:leucyl-tRNA synthetase